jgi:thiamine-monophosphate kinase
LSEQALIQKYFSRHQSTYENVEISVGDDAAIVSPPKDSKLVVTTDTLNSGVHFFPDCKPEHLGHKALAVNLSDIAAMGATPLWATLSLSLPDTNHEWLDRFSNSFYSLAEIYNMKLVGGDMVKGPLSITIQIIGSVNSQQALLRSNCKEGDLIYVSGCLGDAAFGLKLLQDDYTIPLSSKDKNYFLNKFHMPNPRFDISEIIKLYAHAAIDISDGFIIDLQRMTNASGKGAEISLEKIPISTSMKKFVNNDDDIKELLVGGEDYELIFTIDKNHKSKLEEYSNDKNIIFSEVGKVVRGSDISMFSNGIKVELPKNIGHDHFK